VEPDRLTYIVAAFKALEQELTISDETMRVAERLHEKLVDMLTVAGEFLGAVGPDWGIIAEAPVDAHPSTPEAAGTADSPTVVTSPSDELTTLWCLRLPPPLRTRQDLILGALIVIYVCFIWLNVATYPFPESLIQPLGAAIGLLAWAYEHQ
jgi:hypothetical protein